MTWDLAAGISYLRRSLSQSAKPTTPAVTAPAAGAAQPSHGTVYQPNIPKHVGGSEGCPPPHGKRSTNTTSPASSAFRTVEVPCQSLDSIGLAFRRARSMLQSSRVSVNAGDPDEYAPSEHMSALLFKAHHESTAPGRVAPLVDDARHSVIGNSRVFPLPIHPRFIGARCFEDDFVALFFEEWVPPYLSVRYAVAVGKLEVPVDGWEGGYHLDSIGPGSTFEQEFVPQLGDEVSCE